MKEAARHRGEAQHTKKAHKQQKPASAKAQPTTRRAPKNSKRPSSRASAPRPLPPRPSPAPLSTHAHGHHKNAIDHHKPIRSQSFGRPQSAPRPLSPSHPQAPRHATVKLAYLSPLGPTVPGAQARLPLPPPLQRLPGHPQFFPPIQRSSVSSSRPLQPSAPSGTPPLPHRVNQRSSNQTIRAAVYISLHVVVNTFIGGRQPQNKLMRLRTFKKKYTTR